MTPRPSAGGCPPGTAGARADTAHDLVQFLFTNSGVGGTGSALSEGASWLAFAAFVIVALTLAGAGAPVLVAFLLAAAGVLIQIAHTNPFGPLAFGCVLAAAAVLVPWRTQARVARAQLGLRC